VVNQITLSGFGEGSVVATCSSGELALSGGWAVPYTSGATIYRSARSGTRGWAVYVNHPSSVLVTSYAECLKDASGAAMAERSALVSIAPNAADRAYPKCHAGEVVVGGGFAFDVHTDVGLDVFRENSSDTQWWGQALNYGTTTTLATVYAECLAYSGATMHATALTQSGIIAAGGVSSTDSLACPSGYFTSGGGFEDDAGAFVYDMQTQLVLGDSGGSYRVWVVSLYADRGNQNGLWVEAICLHL
jgi:hypothetical protein